MKKINYLFFFIVLLVSSCTSKKNLVYLQNHDNLNNSFSVEVPSPSEYQIKRGDKLYISVVSIDPETNAIFNGSSSNTLTTEASIDLACYSVESDGCVVYPFIGRVAVEGKTISDVQQSFNTQVSKVAPQATVVVKLVNRSITVLGEVRRPGRYTVFKDQMTIFEALGFAGDVTDFGSRTNVKIVRKMGDSQKVWMVNLTQKDVLSRTEMLVQPSDIIYVEPTSRVYGKKTFSVALVISAISTFFALYATFLK